MAADELVVHGAREHNLKDITVRLPRNALICITGLSGSGKSSLAFDTIYAEGQRRYVESLSAYARQFLQMMEKPDVDSIDGLSPAISIDQKTTSRNPRSTVGTVTEIYDYLRLLYARVGRPHCPIDGRPITGQSIDAIVEEILSLPDGTRFTVNAPVVRDRKGRVPGAVRVAPERRLLARQGRRRAAHARGAADARQEVQAHDRGRRRPARDEGGSAHAAHRFGRDGCGARGRARRRRPGRHRRGQDVLAELRVPRARQRAAGAAAAHLLVQLTARRVPALHRSRRAAGDRPRSARARPRSLDRRRRTRSVGGRRLRVLRIGDPGDRRPLRGSDRRRLARAHAGAAGLVPLRHRRRQGLRPVPQQDGPAAVVHDRVRRDRLLARAPLPRDRFVDAARAHRGVHVVPPVPGVQGRAAEARGARGHGRRAQHPPVHEAVDHRSAAVPRRAST